MKNFFVSLIFAFTVSFSVFNISFATETETAPAQENFMPSSHNVFNQGSPGLFNQEQNIIRDYTFNENQMGEHLFKDLMETLIEFLKKLLVPISILLLGWSATYLFLARANADELKKRQNELLGVIGGFAVILLSASLVNNVFFGNEGQALRSTCEGDIDQCTQQLENDAYGFAKNGLIEIEGVINFVSTFVLVVAMAFLVFASYQLIFNGENEEAIDKAKKRLIYSIIGIAIIVSSKSIANVFTNSNGKISLPDVDAILGIGGYWTNKVLGFLGLLSVSALVWAGVQMITNFGNEEKVESAKKIFQYVIIGLVLAFSMWTIVRFFLTAGAPYNLS